MPETQRQITKKYWDLYWAIKGCYPEYFKKKMPINIGFMSPTTLDGSRSKLKQVIGDSQSVLDIGSGDNFVQRAMRSAGHKGVYHTLDLDARFPHEYHDLSEVNQSYDVIVMFNLIEHMPLDDFYAHLAFCESHLNPGGTIAISTPNANHVNCVWKGDMTHIHPLPPQDLYCLFRVLGYDVAMYRTHIVEEHFGILRWIRRGLACLIAWILYADAAEDILLFATRPPRAPDKR